MSTSDKRPLELALQDAKDFAGLFAGCFERWEIAGSVRRGKPQVGDVEHVIIPKIHPISGSLVWLRMNELLQDPDNMFSNPNAPLTKHVYGLLGSHRWGELYRGVDFRGFNHEIFCADALNWGSVLAIRTGPAEFSKMLVTNVLKSGRLRQQDGYLRYPNGSIFGTPSERDYFAACGVDYLEPWKRF